MPILLKTAITALLVLAISEFSKRSTVAGAILASLPITSVIAMIWLYRDTGDLQKVSELSRGIFWAVIPSLVFFVIFPFLVGRGYRFGSSLAISSAVTSVGYILFAYAYNRIQT